MSDETQWVAVMARAAVNAKANRQLHEIAIEVKSGTLWNTVYLTPEQARTFAKRLQAALRAIDAMQRNQ